MARNLARRIPMISVELDETRNGLSRGSEVNGIHWLAMN